MKLRLLTLACSAFTVVAILLGLTPAANAAEPARPAPTGSHVVAQGPGWLIVGSGSRSMVRSKPEVNAIKKMKAQGINQRIRIRIILGAEEDGGCEDSLETLNDSPVVSPVGSEAEEIEHLKGSFKVDDAAFLLDGESGYPNGDQAILAEGDGRFIMHLPQ